MISSKRALQVRKARPGIVAQHDAHGARPAPHRHVDDRIPVAKHVASVGETLVEDPEMALRLIVVAVDRIVPASPACLKCTAWPLYGGYPRPKNISHDKRPSRDWRRFRKEKIPVFSAR